MNGCKIYLCFINYQIAFGSIKREDLMKWLQEVKVNGKDRRIIGNLYWRQSAYIKLSSNKLTDNFQTKDVYSPLSF